MGEISKQTVVSATADKVYNYVTDPRNAPHFVSAITRVSTGIYDTPAEGQVWGAEANLLGSVSHIRLQITRLVPGWGVQFTMLGDPEAALTIRLAPEGDGSQTVVGMTLDVPNMPTILLAGLMSGMVTSDLARLKQIVEGR